jgi:hypothetical protein
MGKKTKITASYLQIKKVAGKGLNIDQTAKKLGSTRKEIMKVIREHF